MPTDVPRRGGRYGDPPTNPTLADFRAQFSEFSDSADADILAKLSEAMIFVDPAMWSVRDYPFAVLYMAAHLLTLMETQQAMTQLSGGGTGVTDIFVRQIGFGERRVAFQQRQGDKSAEATAGPGESLLGETIYGQLFLQLRSRNIIPVMVI